jgi:ribulose-5-phosphate 4-epimerase/fuculose-1-phosphate aldolase
MKGSGTYRSRFWGDGMTVSIAGALPRGSEISAEEWAVRVDLTAAYRLCALHGWTDGTATHLSARVSEDTFLINPFGLLFDEVTASSLVRIDLDGNVVSKTEHAVNLAGYVIHSAVYRARPDVACVMHLHTDDGAAASCLEEGLLPLSQTAMLVCDQLAYHEFEGVAFELDERERLVEHLGERNYMLLHNHGTLTTGRSVAEAFCRMWRLERACAIQNKVLATGRLVKPFAHSARLRTAEVGARIGGPATDNEWAAFKRKLDRISQDYAC